jgi:hypothetical protein
MQVGARIRRPASSDPHIAGDDNGSEGWSRTFTGAELERELTRGYASKLIGWKVRSISQDLGLCTADRDEMTQELKTQVIIRCRSFDGAKGSWRRWVCKVVARCAATCRQRVLRNRRTRLMDGYGMDHRFTAASRFARRGLSHKDVQAAVDLQLDVAEALQPLDSLNRGLCLDLKLKTVSEASRDRGVAQSTVADRARRRRGPLKSLNPRQSFEKPPLNA